MKRIEFTYYDWNEFKRFLDQLADKDAAKLIATIQNIENNGGITIKTTDGDCQTFTSGEVIKTNFNYDRGNPIG